MDPRRAAFVILVTLAAGACNDPAGPGALGDPVDPINELPRDLTSSEVEVINRSNAFGFDLARRVASAEANPNIVISPLSASMALGMTLNGAAGSTLEAMRTALSLDGMTDDEINNSYQSLLSLLTDLEVGLAQESLGEVASRLVHQRLKRRVLLGQPSLQGSSAHG